MTNRHINQEANPVNDDIKSCKVDKIPEAGDVPEWVDTYFAELSHLQAQNLCPIEA